MLRFPLGWALAVVGLACATPGPLVAPGIQAALAAAGDNKAELEGVLEHYQDAGDPQALAAARFLIANMPGHGYAEIGFVDASGSPVPFDALAYGSFPEARDALAELGRARGPIRTQRQRFLPDVESVDADFLIAHVDAALAAWREKPWAAELPFETFLEWVLPYRSSNEPLADWRGRLGERLADLVAELPPPVALEDAARAVLRRAEDWVAFSELYYLHPTDQGFEELLESGVGRCEDQSTMRIYAARAVAVPAATDWTPFWADRDNNHAWEVVPGAPERPALAHRAAKVFRRTYLHEPGSLGAQRRGDEEVPPQLASPHRRDVTAEYVAVSDLLLEFRQPPPPGARFAYLTVFNGGEWRVVHWGSLEGGVARFSAMGRGVLYLPTYYEDGTLRPAGDPFLLDAEGGVHPLDGVPSDALSSIVVPTGRHELFVWEEGWRSLGEHRGGATPRGVAAPAGRLYWRKAVDSRGLERPFTIENGRQVSW